MNVEIKFKEIINKYKDKIKIYNKELESTPFECIFNKQLNNPNLNQIKGIVVMDNPGQEEKEQKEYLVGTAGKAFNKVLNSIGLSRDQVLVLNKSSFTTPATNDLNSVYENDLTKEIFLKEQETTYQIIKNISVTLNIPIMLHGYASYFKNNKAYINNEKSNRPLYIFFKNIHEDKEIQKYIHFFKHSSYGNLSKQITAYSKLINKENINFEEYLELGKLNCKGFFDD